MCQLYHAIEAVHFDDNIGKGLKVFYLINCSKIFNKLQKFTLTFNGKKKLIKFRGLSETMKSIKLVTNSSK